MKNILVAGLLLAASASPAFDDLDDVKAAAKKLADAPNYSWTTTVKNNAENPGQGGGRFAPGPIQGKPRRTA